MMASIRAVSVPGRTGSQASELAAVAVKRGSIAISVAPPAWASFITRQSGIEVSATLLAQSTIALAFRKSVDS